MFRAFIEGFLSCWLHSILGHSKQWVSLSSAIGILWWALRSIGFVGHSGESDSPGASGDALWPFGRVGSTAVCCVFHYRVELEFCCGLYLALPSWDI